MRPMFSINVLPSLPPSLAALKELAYNLWWAWNPEAIELFRRCGLLVLPYVDATQSALIAAAYYFHKPVVVTRAGALPEYVADGLTGRVVEPGHPAALARCLDEMLNDPARLARMGTAGRAWYESHRAAEEHALIEMYRRLTQTKPADDPIIQLLDHPI